MTNKLPALMFALAACGTVDNNDPMQAVTDEPAGDDSPTPGTEQTEFRYFTALADGTAKNTFDSVDAAFLTTGGSLNVAPGNYYFIVNYEVCPPGMNQDEFFPEMGFEACRRFTVDENGVITQRTPVEIDGFGCNRDVGIDGATGGFTIGIMPFEHSVYRCSPLVVRVIPVGGGRLDAVATLFFNAPVPEQNPPTGPVCGNGTVEDGEQCDDGNEADHDGCSALCQIEPDCHPLQH